MSDQSAQYTEEAVGGGHPTKARVIDRLALIALNADGTIKGFADTGTADALAIAISPAITAYTAQQLFLLRKSASANTGACTLNVNGLGAKSIKTLAGQDPKGGDLPASAPLIFMYDGANMVLLNPPVYETGTWTPVLTCDTPGNLSVAYSLQGGRYTKIGKLVFVQCEIQTSAFTHTTASGSAKITGLPFSSLAGGRQATAALRYRGITKAGFNDFIGLITAGVSVVNFMALGSGAADTFLVITDFPTGGTVVVIFAAVYEAA